MLLPGTCRRSMGLPPTQGHNNLRLNNTTNLYSNRLGSRHYNTLKQLFHSQNPSIIGKTSRTKPQLRQKLQSMNQFSNSNCATPSIDHSRNITSNSHRSVPYDYISYRHLYRDRHHRSVAPPTHPMLNQNKITQIDLKRHNLESVNNCTFGRHDRRPAIVSNMPQIKVNSSIVLVNRSPFGLRDPRFGIFHHCSQSISYL